jgi:hypothetical protein
MISLDVTEFSNWKLNRRDPSNIEQRHTFVFNI